MSSALTTKWIYKYTNSKDALWRKVMCARSKSNLNSVLPCLGNNGKSVFLRFINVAIGSSGQAREAISQQFKILVGDGRDTNFGTMIGPEGVIYGNVFWEFLHWLLTNQGRCLISGIGRTVG